MSDMKKWRVLIVDDEPNNLKLMRQILSGKYQLSIASSGIKAIDIAKKVKPELILLDIMMPNMDGYETCRRLKSDPETTKIPVVFITAKSEVEDEKRGFDVGAVDYITKPISKPIVLTRVATHLALYDQQRSCEELIALRTGELQDSQKAAVFMLGEAGHFNDTDTGVHIWRMAAYSGLIARSFGWHFENAAVLELAAPMHDNGKIGIPDSILKKPGKLTSDEWFKMKTHTTIGYRILKKSDSPLFKMAADIALYHHEKWDGMGYPYGLKGLEIPESARIVAIADVFDALTMKRPYKDAWSIDDALKEIKANSGKHFDPTLIDSFFSIKEKILEMKHKWDTRE